MILQQINYSADSTLLFSQIRHWPWAVLLDSQGLGRYDIICADPCVKFTVEQPHCWIETRDKTSFYQGDVFRLLADYLAFEPEIVSDLPFIGGALGYVAYDWACHQQGIALPAHGLALPQIQIGLYDWALVIDHHQQCSQLVSLNRDAKTRRVWPQLIQLFNQPTQQPSAPFHIHSPAQSEINAVEYAQSFAKIQHYIRAGDCYQINFARHFSAQASGDAWTAYQYLRQHNPAPFAAYLHYSQLKILSSSPERFLRLRHHQVLTQPIKGTRARGQNAQQDVEIQQELQQCAKDRAENLMIVDLLRNDLSKVCLPHSVKVGNLFKIQQFATVHHLVSDISGTIAPSFNALDLFQACFAGGSITGAPKRRAMQIIAELEPYRRSVYCGCVLYIGFDGQMDSNICIRTLLYHQRQVHFWAGGGIVADSQLDTELQETQDKAKAMLDFCQYAKKP
jgi:para-aminobenzoate synthetase component 1